MVQPPRSVAIYARISRDIEGSGLGVARQLEDCRRLITELGWPAAVEYVDNDLSAYSGKTRPEYQRMLADIREGQRDAVVVYHMDRLTRRPIELEEFVRVLDAAKVRDVKFVSGGMDLGTGDGLLIARIQAAIAANSSASLSRRVRRKLDQNATAGKPHGGYHRPFGYEADKVAVRAAEAAVIPVLVGRYVAGESLRSLCRWLDAEDIRTVDGNGWRTTTLRNMLSSGRIAGLREHRGQLVGPAVWPAIITPADRDKVLVRMAASKASRRRTPRRYLLSGQLRCDRCGGTLFASPRGNGRRYVCLSGPDHGGCGKMSVTAEPLEQLVTDAVLYRLDTSALADALAGRMASDDQASNLAEVLAADRSQLEELAGFYAEKQITATEWLVARRAIEDRIHDAERRLSTATGTEAIVGLAHGDALRTQWATLNLTRQAAIVRTILDHAVIKPGLRGAQRLDPDRVIPVWRV